MEQLSLFALQVPLVRGYANFDDLGLTVRGNYVLEYVSTFGDFVVQTPITVQYSPVYETVASDMYPRDFYGSSVDIDGGYAVVGAPFAHKPVNDVQSIITSASSTVFVNEIQVVHSVSEHRWEVQRIEVFLDPTLPDVNVTGHFTLGWNGQVSTRLMPADIFDAYVKVCQSDVAEALACTNVIVVVARPLCR